MAEKKLRGKSRKKGTGILLFVLFMLFAVVMVLSICKIVRYNKERIVGAQAYTSLAQRAVTRKPVQEQEERGEETQQATTKQTATVDVSRPSLEVDFAALQALNPQVVAWISSDDESIHYPVVQGTDNHYYLNHLVDGTVNANGSVFMDFRNDASLKDPNTFIYGHNMRDGTMFASLQQYSSPGYCEAHPELLLTLPQGSYSLQVFAGCVVPGNSDVYQLSYRDEDEFTAYLEKICSISQFSTHVEVGGGDRIVTLSTCAYDYDDARFVLFSKLVPMQ